MLVRVTAPDPIITPHEGLARLRLDHVDDVADLEAMIAAATGLLDGKEGWLARALGPQTWDLKLDGGWPYSCRWYEYNTQARYPGFRLPLPPLISVVSITYKDEDGDAQTYDAENYVVSGVGDTGFVSLAPGASWPTTWAGPEALTIRFQAGFSSGVPEPIKQAILLLAGHFYENREVVARQGQAGMLPFTVDSLISTYRVW